MESKNIEAVIRPRTPHFVGDGFRVHNFIPKVESLSRERMNPFVMLDYNAKYNFPPTGRPKGVGAHPHRGFETVTIVYKGKIAHHDSSGNSGIIGEGDVQWMTAARGILHQEYHEQGFSKTGGEVHMVQLWVNLPARDKKSKPKYQDIASDSIGRYTLPGANGTIEVIAGEYMGVKGPAYTFSLVNLFNAKLQSGAKADFGFSPKWNTGLLVIDGTVRVNNGEDIPADHFILMENVGTSFTLEASQDAIVLILSGEPIDEPIFSQGPFVMNSPEELSEAFMDYNMGKFGFMD